MLEQQFQEAAALVRTRYDSYDRLTQVRLYALYKQATQGDVTGERPGEFEFLERAKYDAWAYLRGMSWLEAQRLYVELAHTEPSQ